MLIIAGVKFEISTMLLFTLFLWPLYNLNQDPSYSYYTYTILTMIIIPSPNGSGSKPCTCFVHIKIAGLKWMFITHSKWYFHRYWFIAKSLKSWSPFVPRRAASTVTHVFRRPFSPSTSGSPEVLGRPRGTATAWRGQNSAVDEGWF